MTAETLQAVFSVREAAVYLRLGHNHVRELLGSGSLVGWRTSESGSWRVSRSACDDWIERQETSARREHIRIAQ